MIKVLLIAAGGAAGTLLRYWISGYAYKIGGGDFPWGTLVVNLIGAFFIGLLWGLTAQSALSSQFRAMIFIGLFGGFTTFSTFALESFNLLKDQQIRNAFYYIVASNIAGIMLVFAGLILARFIIQIK